MENPRQDDSGSRTVQAHRFELVDSKGRVRAVLGHIGTADDGFEPGLELYDRSGSARTSLALHEWGPMLDFAVDGNGVLALGVNDESEFADDSSEYDPVTYVSVNDGDGGPVLRVEAHHDGRWEAKLPPTKDADGGDITNEPKRPIKTMRPILLTETAHAEMTAREHQLFMDSLVRTVLEWAEENRHGETPERR